jgi:hypothetical protein
VASITGKDVRHREILMLVACSLASCCLYSWHVLFDVKFLVVVLV